MLKASPPTNGIRTAHSRTLHVLRCSAAAEPVAPPTGPAASAGGLSSDRRLVRPNRPRRAQNAEVATSSAPRDGERPQRRGDRDAEQGRSTKRLPEVVFLEEDPSGAGRKAKVMFTKFLADRSSNIAAYSLGRAGTAGAVRFLLDLRAAGAQAAQPCDIRVRLGTREPISPFGTPMLMFVEGVEGRVAPPSDPEMEAQRDSIVTVSSRTEFQRLEERLYRLMSAMPVGAFIRVDMVGNDNVHRGMMALSAARARLSRGGGIFFVPEVVTERVRASQQQQQQAPSDATAVHNGAAAAHNDAAAAPAAEEEAPYVDVVRFHVSRAGPSPVAPFALKPLATQPAQAQARPAAAPAAPADAADAPGGDGQILVSVAEWEALRGALGSMLEQQKALTALLEQQKAAAAPTEPSSPSA